LHIVRDGGHLFLVSDAREVVPVMREFLDKGEAWEGLAARTVASPMARKKAA
jgi:hypothetical protein